MHGEWTQLIAALQHDIYGGWSIMDLIALGLAAGTLGYVIRFFMDKAGS